MEVLTAPTYVRSTRATARMRHTGSMLSLVTGATGYIGGRLVPQLLDAGHDVRVLARDGEKARAQPWGHEVEIVVGDATRPEDVERAVDGVDILSTTSCTP